MSKDKQPKDPAEQGKEIKTAADLIQDENNYRKHSDTNKARIRKSIDEAGLGRSVVIDADGVLVAGNGVQSVIDKDTPVRVVETDGTELVVVKRTDLHTGDPRRKTLALADNATSDDVEWDFDAIAEDWTEDEVVEWGVEWPADEEEMQKKEKLDKREDVEEMLNKAMVENVKEAFTQINQSLSHGWLLSGLTLGMCKAKFIRAKYYGERYPKYLSLYFTPEIFKTSAKKKSLYDTFKDVAEGKTKAGVAGFRTLSEDGNTTTTTTKCGYPVASGRLPLDFDANTCRDLLQEFGGGRVLDPCHGWGGRLVGALLADVESYTGVDPSDEASAGVHKIAEAYHDYAPDTEVTLLKMPFEDTALEDGAYDIAITSPPYFDVEQYHGEQQSHVRYPKYDLWRDGFYRQLIAKVYDYLRDGGTFILQVGSQSYPLLEDGKKIAAEVGFRIIDVRQLGGMTSSALHGNTDEDEENEKIVILRK